MPRYVEDVDGVRVPAPEPAAQTARSHDRYVVNAAPLAEALHTFVQGWERMHPVSPSQRDRVAARRPTVTPYSAVEWLAAETARVDPTDRGVPARTIENFLRRDAAGRPAPRYPTTDLRIADALLTAVGRPDMLYDEALNIRPRRRRASHTASLTGVVEPFGGFPPPRS